jgi:PAS domain S-box-containing protein
MVVTDLTDRKRQEETSRRLLQEETARSLAEEVARQAQRAETILRESEERFRTLAVSTPMVVWTNLPNGQVDYISQRWYDLTGQTPEQLCQSPSGWLSALHPEDRERAEAIYLRSVQAGEPFEMETRFRRASDGVYRWHLNRAVPLRDASGAVVKFVGTCTDIDDLKRSEEQIRFQARLLDSVGQAAIATDPDGKIVYWNLFAETLYGWPREEALGTNLLDLVIAPTEVNQRREILQQMEAGNSWSGECLVRHRDGTIFPAFVSETPLLDAQGNLRAIIGISTDITERKHVEQGLRFLADASATLSALVDWQSTLQKVAALAVPHFADWCVIDMAAPDGSLQRLAVAHADPTKVKQALQLPELAMPDRNASHGSARVLRSGKSEIIEDITDPLLVQSARSEQHLTVLRQLGLKSYMGVPLLARGKALGVISFVVGDSGRRYTRSDLAFAEELSRRAAVALENAQLYAELRETDRLKDEFLAMLAHELRNPLAPIRNSLHIMKQSGTDRALINQVREMAERQVQHMARLLDDLLDVSRISRGKIELHNEPVDVKMLVSRTVEAIQPYVEERRHRLTVSLDPEPVCVLGDATRLEQVITNLLNNSVKYTDPGGTIQLSVTRENGRAILKVQDNGIGIAPDMLPKIFDLFVQAERRVNRAQGGVGIGLTLVRRLVELHGGAIEAHSKGLGQGSEFIVHLPALEDPILSEEPVILDGKLPNALPRLRVLVVDDNQDAADSLAMLLELIGQDVRAAYDGPTSLVQAEAFRPAMVFLDIGMPGMDGYEVARRMRSHHALGQVVLVALTGWGQDGDRRRSREAGFDRHLVKPVDPATLQEVLALGVPSRS